VFSYEFQGRQKSSTLESLGPMKRFASKTTFSLSMPSWPMPLRRSASDCQDQHQLSRRLRRSKVESFRSIVPGHSRLPVPVVPGNRLSSQPASVASSNRRVRKCVYCSLRVSRAGSNWFFLWRPNSQDHTTRRYLQKKERAANGCDFNRSMQHL
jgi:hypothetical protein